MPSDALLALARSQQTVTSALEADPTQAPEKVAAKLFPKQQVKAAVHKAPRTHDQYTKDDLDRAEQCGKFPHRPSDLFLKMYSDVLDTLEHNPLNGMVSPPLIGSSGIVPLSIVSLIPDIMRYYKILIMNAKFEVYLATNYWQASWASHFIRDALIELSKRHADKPTKMVVKLIVDRGSPKQVIKNHIPIPASEWEGLNLPRQDEIPNIDFEVMNYHRPVMGTFHAKFMVIDRRIAIINSNNIMDRVNLEQMIHLEGPIVESFYDMSLLSWAEKLDPPLPLLKNPSLVVRDNASNAFEEAISRKEEMHEHAADSQPGHPEEGTPDAKTPPTDFTLLNTTDFRPVFLHKPHAPMPIAMVNRAAHGTPDHADHHVPQNAAWLAGFRLAQHSIIIQTPDFNNAAVEPILDACRRGVEATLYICLGYNDGGEMLPRQGGTNSKVMADMASILSKEGKRHLLKAHWYVAKDRQAPVDAVANERNCHVKFCCIDGQVAILGNGNQDTQSWFHSQEANVMIDSAEWCTEFIAGLEHNQNTAAYGSLGEDGQWRDKNGNIVESSGGKGGMGKMMKGMLGAVARVRGKGGF